MKSRSPFFSASGLAATGITALTLSLACGGGGGGSSVSTPSSAGASTGTVAMSVSDASTENWATIGVKILSITLTPQAGGTPVTVYTAPSTVPVTNLVQLDNLSEILSAAPVAAGVYTGATLTLSANPGDVALVAAADPEAGFAGTAGATIAPAQIQIQKTKGTAPNLTVPVSVTFAAPVTVTSGQITPLDLEFDLSHPAFIVDHVPASGAPFWAVSFNGPMVHHNPIHDITRLVLRHAYGTVASVAANNTAITFTRDHAVYPPTAPETAITTTNAVTVLADAANKTLFYDVDAKTVTPIPDFSSVASTLPTKFVRVAARYQQDGTLVATRIWASTSFAKVWISPEGHVLHVDTSNPALPVLAVANESGASTNLQVNASTQFFFRTYDNVADAVPIATGPTFITNKNLVRGFKIHASTVDPLATPLVAQTVDIEIARYDGDISLATANGFTYTRAFSTKGDDYSVALPFIASGLANGKDANGNPIDGFKWWDFAYPTSTLQSGVAGITAFDAATGGGVDFFSDPTKAVSTWGLSGCLWNSGSNAWDAAWTVLEPVPLPTGSVATAWSASATGGSFGLSLPTGTITVPVTLSTVAGSATLVYQVDKTNGIVTVSPEDITNSTVLANVAQNLSTLGTKVKVYGIPQANSTVMSYVVFYYTGTAPGM